MNNNLTLFPQGLKVLNYSLIMSSYSLRLCLFIFERHDDCLIVASLKIWYASNLKWCCYYYDYHLFIYLSFLWFFCLFLFNTYIIITCSFYVRDYFFRIKIHRLKNNPRKIRFSLFSAISDIYVIDCERKGCGGLVSRQYGKCRGIADQYAASSNRPLQ